MWRPVTVPAARGVPRGADEGGVAGIVEQAERLPEAEGGLHRAGVGVEPTALRVPRASRAPAAR